MPLPEEVGLESTRSGAITSNGDSLFVFTESLKAFGNRLTGDSTTVGTSIGEVGSSVANIGQSWTDTTGGDAIATVSSINDAYAPVVESVATLGQFVVNIADKYETALQTCYDNIDV